VYFIFISKQTFLLNTFVAMLALCVTYQSRIGIVALGIIIGCIDVNYIILFISFSRQFSGNIVSFCSMRMLLIFTLLLVLIVK
jgi:hypothetical protein